MYGWQSSVLIVRSYKEKRERLMELYQLVNSWASLLLITKSDTDEDFGGSTEYEGPENINVTHFELGLFNGALCF
jgi:hypothetical protein